MSQHPQIHAERRWTIACTVCGLDSYGDRLPSFSSEDEMWEAILGPHGYAWTRRDDGRVLCRHQRSR
jgi:hypothetical protein